MSELKLTRFETADEFLESAEEYLLVDEIFNNLPLGICYSIRKNPTKYGDIPPYFAVVESSSGPEAIAVRTPPYDLIVYSDKSDPQAPFTEIASDVQVTFPDLSGVNGPLEQSGLFAEIWCERTGQTYQRIMHSRIYELKEVIHPEGIAGEYCVATEADLDLVLEWMAAFDAEAVPDAPGINREQRIRDAVKNGSFFLWKVRGEPVSTAAKARPMLNGTTVNGVYTPPDLRRNGYATALVAALSQHLLDQGWQFCTLFTDMSNPTSNSIYQKIGYKPIGDYANHRFV